MHYLYTSISKSQAQHGLTSAATTQAFQGTGGSAHPELCASRGPSLHRQTHRQIPGLSMSPPDSLALLLTGTPPSHSPATRAMRRPDKLRLHRTLSQATRVAPARGENCAWLWNKSCHFTLKKHHRCADGTSRGVGA